MLSAQAEIRSVYMLCSRSLVFITCKFTKKLVKCAFYPITFYCENAQGFRDYAGGFPADLELDETSIYPGDFARRPLMSSSLADAVVPEVITNTRLRPAAASSALAMFW